MTKKAQHIPSVNFNFINDKNLGDFNSALWSKIGFDEVREDLLKYYLTQKEQIPELSFGEIASRKLYKKRRNKDPNRCFSYATGLLSYEDATPDPFILKAFDLSNPDIQAAIFTSGKLMNITLQTFSTNADFHEEISHGDFKKMALHNEKDYGQVNPVVMLNHVFDFHLIKTDIYTTNSGPIILFTDKFSSNRISEDRTLESFSQNHDDLYINPALFGSPKNLVDRQMNGHYLPGNNLFVELLPVKKFKKRQPN